MNKAQEKVAKVMHEFKEGNLKSHGKTVTDRKQAIAIALNTAGVSKYGDGGETEGLNIGDIYKLPDDVRKAQGKEYYYTVIYRKLDNSTYSYYSDKHGNVDYSPHSANIIHSNYWLGETPEKVGHKKLVKITRTIGNDIYSYYLSGNKNIDTEMANLDERWQAFAKHAGKKLMDKYDKQENDNYHYENAKMVTDWFNKQQRLNRGGTTGGRGGSDLPSNYFVYKWYEERGDLTMYVEDKDNNYLWEYNNEPDTSSPVDDGFMENLDDTYGLEKYLIDLKILPADATVIDEDTALQKYDHYKHGGIISDCFSFLNKKVTLKDFGL